MAILATASRLVGAFFGWNGRAANAFPGSKTDEQYPARPELALDQKDMLGRMQHRALLNSGRHIYNAYPMVSGAINDIANHAIGQSWDPQYKGKYPEFGDAAESWLREYSKICDVRGHPYSLTIDMHVGVVTICRDGEFFLHLTSNADGYPMVQFLEAHRIGTRSDSSEGKVLTGLYAGLPMRNGIAYNEVSRPIAYHYLGDNPIDDQWVPAERMIHVFDPKWFSQGRGISPLVYGILDWLDVHGWRQNEKIAQLMLSSIALLETNEEGAPNTLASRMKEIANAATAGTQPTKAKEFVEILKAGATRFFKINGSNLKALESKRPSPEQANFEERLLRGCFRALGWTYEQALDSKGQGGANVRRDVAQNQKSIEHIQDIVLLPWRRVIVYALAAANEIGALYSEDGDKIELPVDWYRWRPQLPQKMTVDHGRDRRMDVEEVRTGLRTMITDIRDRGGDENTHLDEQIQFHKLKREKARVADIPREEWVECFGSLLVNPTAAPTEQAPDNPNEDEDGKPVKPAKKDAKDDEETDQ